MTPWPTLRIADWHDTYATLQLYAQIVGKIRLAFTPKLNEWWNVAFYVTPRGLTTSAMPYEERTFSIDFDFIDHQIVIAVSDGQIRRLPLTSIPVCDFHRDLFAELAAVGVQVHIDNKPQECPVVTPLSEDREHSTYDAAAARRFFEALRRIEPVFQRFRAGFRGKCSPVHFFWGACDLAVSRFNGRRAPQRHGKIERDAYDEEVISLGFWPGDAWNRTAEAMLYSYTVPEPTGLRDQRVRPAGAAFSDTFKEFVLPYEEVRRSSDPAAAILEFAESTYAAGASLAGWDKAGLEYRAR